MGKVLEELTDKEAKFIAASKVFFVATAPLSAEHHVSVSPKAPGNSCVVLAKNQVAYADLTGSGAETAAHVLQNGRMTIMFCNLEKQGPPQILRLYGKAELILAADASSSLKSKFPSTITSSFGFRAIYKLHVHRVSTSCGYSLPQMEFVKYRSTLNDVTAENGKMGMYNYMTKKNSYSIDGLPSLALLRLDGPKHVEPVVEDGFIYGKVVTNKATTNTKDYYSMEQAIIKMHKRRKNYYKVDVSLLHLLIGVVVTFAIGVIVGPTLTDSIV